MVRRAVLAIDQGTTNTKVVVLDELAQMVATASEPVEVRFPKPGWVEQDPRGIWATVETAVASALQSLPAEVELAAAAITNQRESAIAWDRATAQPLGPCITWQCRRTAAFCEELRSAGASDVITRRTGLAIDPLFSATKFRWLLDSIPGGWARASRGEICLGNVDAWILWNLTGGAVHATDLTNASRTQLLNLHTARWDAELLDLFGIPAQALPQLQPSSHRFGETTVGGPVGRRIPIGSAIGDSHAALFGQAAFDVGAVKATYGTGSSLMGLAASPVASTAGLSTTVAWAFEGDVRYAREGNITVTGGAVDWLVGLLGRQGGPAEIARLSATVDDAGGVHLVPAFAGLGAPYWDAHARGVITGLTQGTTAAHLARATIESIAFQVRDVFEAMQQGMQVPAATLLADGGASRNDALMQFQADVIGCPVVRSESADLSAVGAAWLAGLSTGVWSSIEELARLPRLTRRYEPRMPADERARRCAAWADAVRRAR